MRKRIVLSACFLLYCLCSVAQLQTPCPPYSFEENNGGRGLRSALAADDMQFVVYKADTAGGLETNTELKALCSGYVKECSYSIDDSGTKISLPDGASLWRLGISCPGAAAISMVLDSFNIPDGAMVHVRDVHGRRYMGGFGSANNNVHNRLPIRPFEGDSLILEYYEPADAAFGGSLRVARISYETICPTAALRRTGSFGVAEKCSPHTSTEPELDNLKRAVCLQYIINGTKAYYSTGSLINNTAGKPYIYTAAHNSYASVGEAEDYVCYFNYEVPALDSLVRGTAECTMAGATVIAKAVDLDFVLLELNNMPPKSYRPYMLGWTADTPNGYFVCIQHPEGDTKRYSLFYGSLSAQSFSPDLKLGGFWWVSQWSRGTTAGGSSGSPLIDRSRDMVVGVLTGGASECAKPISDFFSRFDLAFDYHSESDKQLKSHLDVNGEGLRSMEGKEMYDQPCVRESNMQAGSKPAVESLSTNNYYAGHNDLQYSAYAEKFTFDNPQTLTGVYVMQYLSSYKYYNNTYLRIYEGGDSPGAMLYETQLPKYSSGTVAIISSAENFIALPQEIEVGNSFYISCELEYAANMDRFALYSADVSANTAYFETGGLWVPFTEHPARPANVSLWVEPVVYDNVASEIKEDTSAGFAVFPNPSRGEVNVRIPSGNGFSYSVFDLSGRECAHGESADGSIKLPGERGFYIVSVSADGETHTEKVLRL